MKTIYIEIKSDNPIIDPYKDFPIIPSLSRKAMVNEKKHGFRKPSKY